ncbi:MAG: hypothetical protein Q8O76_08510 [Chloroflexota bacterium]|nr:hypothetical protein [Chloroflexota bacterium]
MPRELRPPAPPRLPNKFPFEDQTAALLDRLSGALAGNPVMVKIKELRDKAPYLAEYAIPTPLGTMTFPKVELPELNAPEVDERKRQVIKAAIGDDLSSLIDKIPYVGLFAGPISDFLEDISMAKAYDLLTPEETVRFRNLDKVSPWTTLAAIRTFARRS